MPLPNFFRPLAGAFGVELIESDAILGTGGTSIGNSTTTSIVLPCPRRKAILSSLTLNAQVAGVMGSGTILAQLFKRDNSGTPADRTLTATISLANDVVTTAGKSYAWPITGTVPNRSIVSGDLFRIDVVTTGTVNTQPTISVCAVWDVIQ